MFKLTHNKLKGAGIVFGVIGAFIILIVIFKDISGDDYNYVLAGFGYVFIIIGVILFIIGYYRYMHKKSKDINTVPNIATPTPRQLFYEKTQEFYEQKLRELGFSKQLFNDYCYPVSGGSYYYGINNGSFYQIETDSNQYHSRYGYPFELTFSDVEKLTPIELEYLKIPIDKIQFFAKEGDIQYTTQVSGGGGGGSSLVGAVVGGIIAGEAGAIIGSRKEIAPITTKTNTHDTRQTILKYYEGDTLKVLSYKGTDMYDYFLQNFPEKDILSVQLTTKTTTQDEGARQKLIELKMLFEEGLIDEIEYKEKRQEILKEI